MRGDFNARFDVTRNHVSIIFQIKVHSYRIDMSDHDYDLTDLTNKDAFLLRLYSNAIKLNIRHMRSHESFTISALSYYYMLAR